MQPASASDMLPAISLLEKTPQILETLLGDLPGELLHWKPAPDRWSISEVLGHLSALEAVYADRALRIVAEESPPLMKYDLAGACARGDYSRGSAGENLALFTRTRRSTLAMLTGLPASAGARTGVHSELGTITLSHMLNEWANHDLGHLRQIAELYRAHAFHPHSGPFMQYSNPKP
ncbi:MAG TPA: DinB family protein [Candidatus Angelobacter sp.]|nr:DinB family protein [Candidatus Angelobacter sp.]